MQLQSAHRAVYLIVTLTSTALIGCGPANETTAPHDNDEATGAADTAQLDPHLDGKWIVTQWTTHQGDFPGGRGRRFIFDGASLTKHNEDGSDETQHRLIAAQDGDNRGFAMHNELDFNEDGEPDMVFLRHALYRFADGQLQISYGTMNAQIDLSNPSSSSPQESSMPTSWEPTQRNDVVILERAESE